MTTLLHYMLINILQVTNSFDNSPKLLGDLLVKAVQLTLYRFLPLRRRLESEKRIRI
jgi:hypothetical protein